MSVIGQKIDVAPDNGERKLEIQTRLGPLNIKLAAIRRIVSALTLDLVRGEAKPSPAEEPKIECEITLGEQLITLTESRAAVSAYILDLLREYPEIAAAAANNSALRPRSSA